MIHGSHAAPQGSAHTPLNESIPALLKVLREGVEAVKDPQIEDRVREYFDRHPTYSCDLIHVAAVARGFQEATHPAAGLTPSIPTAKGILATHLTTVC